MEDHFKALEDASYKYFTSMGSRIPSNHEDPNINSVFVLGNLNFPSNFSGKNQQNLVHPKQRQKISKTPTVNLNFPSNFSVKNQQGLVHPKHRQKLSKTLSVNFNFSPNLFREKSTKSRSSKVKTPTDTARSSR